MKKTIFLSALAMLLYVSASACTNFIITRGASTDGSNMVTYAADSHALYGSLYQYVPGKYNPFMDVREWDSGRPLGQIAQVATTYRTLGNSNEHSLFITETTFGGRPELADPKGGIDYGSLIYITLQRAKTAREAIQIIVDLANTYGYASSGESFSLIDQQEAWIMELIGKGPNDKGIVWVARRIPDGYVSAHANQARITTFPWDDPENCLYAPDVADVARKFGWFKGENKDFSFSDAYAPADFGALRGCEARVWALYVFSNNIYTVMGPTPPGTGVIADAIPNTSSKSTSPDNLFPIFEMPTSKTIAPGFIQSFFIIFGQPHAATTISAVFTISTSPIVLE